jgi:cytochrome c oxidase assembly protein subunit 15
MSSEDWQAEFDQYKQTPQYLKVNQGMDLDAFKGIFWWEYGHRLLGRLIGIAFALPFFYFLLQGRISRKLRPKMLLLLALGGLQGFMGWYMVKSGLIDRPGVSHYRLTAHLGLALIIYSYMLWTAMGLKSPPRRRGYQPSMASLKATALLLFGLISLQIMLGGFVAGLRAGLIDNTWPLMEGGIVPSGLFALTPWYRNFLENLTTVQFTHRLIAYAVVLVTVVFWARARQVKISRIRVASHFLLAAVLCQLVLGILTLVYVVPVALGAAHQAGAVMVLTAMLYAMRRIWPA